MDYHVAMSEADWNSVDFTYEIENEAGELVEATQIEECYADQDDPSMRICRIRLGHFADYQDRGLTQPWQMRAAVQCPPGAWCLHWYATQWVDLDPPTLNPFIIEETEVS